MSKLGARISTESMGNHIQSTENRNLEVFTPHGSNQKAMFDINNCKHFISNTRIIQFCIYSDQPKTDI